VTDTHLARLLSDRRTNALLAWALVGLLVLVAAESLRGDRLWAGFAVAVATLALFPPVVARDHERMLPWEVLVMAALPILGRALATTQITGALGTYLSVAAIALIVAVELHAFTTVRMTPGFAIGFVVVATAATAGVWAVIRWGLDITLGTQFLLVPGVASTAIEHDLMWEFVFSTAAGLLGGVTFEVYFRRWRTEVRA
jgi:hypothetical protein